MRRIGYDEATGVLVIAEGEVFPARSLRASCVGGMVTIRSLAERAEVYEIWSDIGALDGSGFATCEELMDYLEDEFSRSPLVGVTDMTDLLTAYILARD